MRFDDAGAIADLREYRPAAWDQIPDLGLYMDQVVTFITRACAPLYGEEARRCISPAMINNYVKARLIPRPSGKKYSRDQLALLIMIVTLKQVSTMEDIRRMLTLDDGERVESLYESFRRRFETALRGIPAGCEAAGSPASAMDFAIVASAYSAASAAVLEAMSKEASD